VSEAGTMPTFQSSGTPRVLAALSIAVLSASLPTLARWERPIVSNLSFEISQPGLFGHGPEEKFGHAGVFTGFTAGAVFCFVISYPFR